LGVGQGEVSAVIAEALERVWCVISDQLAEEFSGVREVFDYISSLRGKMYRPSVMLAWAEAFGGISDEHITASAVVEMAHTATLMHDDVIDRAASRRGNSTVNKVFGNKQAVLAGDMLLSKAFVLAGKLETAGIAEMLSATAVRLCRGEMRQNNFKDWRVVSEEEYLEIIADKTAALFEVCCAISGLVSGVDERAGEAMASYGYNVGMAFQIADDLLDISGDEKVTGKSGNVDLSQSKATLAVIHYLEGSEDERQREDMLEKIIKAGGKSELVGVLSESGAIGYAFGRARDYSDKAVAAAEIVQDAGARIQLEALAKKAVDRNS
jgi:octaprenyl-diphosphate synthase